MTTTHPDDQAFRKPLRLWPGVLTAVVIVLLRFAVPLVMPEATMYGVLAAVAGALVIIIWWIFFSRAPWSERIGAIVLMIVATFATRLIVHRSVAGGMMGLMLPMYAVPSTLGPAFVAWAVATRRLSNGVRRATMVLTILLACGVWTLFRTDGIMGESGAQLTWRWTPTAEERLLAKGDDEPKPLPPAPAAVETAKEPLANPAKSSGKPSAASPSPVATTAPATTPADTPGVRDPGSARAEWPGFRGPSRDGIIRSTRINTDWSASPPVEMWRRAIGPGWSSFAVHGDLLYTQEQRGDDEVVSSYRLTTGEPVWRHRDAVRFWESNAGAGPRATPTLGNGRVYTFGATGIVNALDARNGAVVWSRNASTDTGVTVPDWGFASSPLVIDDIVVVAAAGQLVAYAAATGEPRWFGPKGGAGYSSPHVATIDGVAQILLLRGSRTISVAPADGRLLWEHAWQPGVGIIQPAFIADRDVLITTGDARGGVGMRRVAVAHGSAGWTVQERWTSRGLKPYFNDFVVHKGHAFGFDGSILSCIDLENGERKWKGGRYGQGQLVVLAEQDVLLVLSEEGELALVKAAPDQFTELARFKAIEGKTWNHPVLVGDILLVRNGEEMAAFRLPLAGR